MLQNQKELDAKVNSDHRGGPLRKGILDFATTRKKILVVDDDPDVLLLYSLTLSEEYDVVTAQDGQQAIEEAAKEGPDLILMDVMMPRMNGLEACRRIRQQPSTKTVPIIMVTSKQEESVRKAAFESGCDDYLVKPTDWHKLVETIRAHLEAPR